MGKKKSHELAIIDEILTVNVDADSSSSELNWFEFYVKLALNEEDKSLVTFVADDNLMNSSRNWTTNYALCSIRSINANWIETRRTPPLWHPGGASNESNFSSGLIRIDVSDINFHLSSSQMLFIYFHELCFEDSGENVTVCTFSLCNVVAVWLQTWLDTIRW